MITDYVQIDKRFHWIISMIGNIRIKLLIL